MDIPFDARLAGRFRGKPRTWRTAPAGDILLLADERTFRAAPPIVEVSAMPDTRKHRGSRPDDDRLFEPSRHPALLMAAQEYAWLLTRGYAQTSALALVGNRHKLTERQRMAVRRSSCSDQALRQRLLTRGELAQRSDLHLGIDGYNLLITVETALSRGLILIGRDGCYRDLASVHGTYRKVEETRPAVELIARHLEEAGVAAVDWYLDRPVSNSARLKVLMAEVVAPSGGASAGPVAWNIELLDSPDRRLVEYGGLVVSSDSWILDRCAAWVNLAADIVDKHLPNAWTIDLGRG